MSVDYEISTIRRALEKIEESYRNGTEVKTSDLTKVSMQVWNIVSELEPEHSYDVSLNCNFEAKTPEGAVAQFIEWMTENSPYDWVYMVEDENGSKTEVDAWKLERS